MYSKKKWVHSRIGQCVRPSVYTITFERRVRSGWKFQRSSILIISRSSSKMSLIERALPDLLQKYWFFLWFPMIFLWEIGISLLSLEIFLAESIRNHTFYIPFDREFNKLQNGMWNIRKYESYLIYCVLKSEYTQESASMSHRPSGRLRDNSSQIHLIMLKLCA